MANFSDHLDGLDAAVKEKLCDDATYVPATGSPVPGHRVMLELPSEAQPLQGASIVLDAPTLEVEVAAVPALKRGDAFDIAQGPLAGRWRLAESPKKPGDGRWWRAAVEKVTQP